jgi:hypothetical protein
LFQRQVAPFGNDLRILEGIGVRQRYPHPNTLTGADILNCEGVVKVEVALVLGTSRQGRQSKQQEN